MQYRREIDGLRAIAVIPVILFHAGFSFFCGGFVGVDIFFVISGYLISSIIYQDLKQGRFSFVDFYERRSRRILPALYFVLLSTVPFSIAWLQASDLKDYFESLSAVSVFSSNILFWSESGYFDTAAELKPLLHTWSLAVEEQYYLLAPLLIYCIWRSRKSLYVAFSLLLFLSLIGAEWASAQSPSAGFFLLPTRAWELLIGGLCAVYLSSPNQRGVSMRWREAGALLGLILIGVATFTFSKDTPFPGLYALVPTLGAALIILCAENTIVGRLLAAKYLVGVGLISYSAYLWHQPLFSFARHRSMNEPSQAVFIGFIGLSMFLAYLSWRYVEAPFRARGNISRSWIFIMAAVGLVGIFTMGLYGRTYLVKENTPVLAWATNGGVPQKLRGVSMNGSDCSGRDPGEACRITKGPYDRTFVIVGDSHARGMTQSIEPLLEQYRVRMVDLTSSGCPLLPRLSVFANGAVFNRCDPDYQEKRLAQLRSLSPSTVILISRFTSYIRGQGFNNTVGGNEIGLSYYAATAQGVGVEQRTDEIGVSFDRALKKLIEMGHRVVVVGPAAPPGWDPLARLYRIERLGAANSNEERQALMRVPYTAVQAWDVPARKVIDKAVRDNPGVIFVDPDEITCADGYCTSITSDSILYSDSNHLSLVANQALFKLIMESLEK
ncbi:acyltransferase family protein [Pseudomonas caspiana]|uniref:acyltransferase family protein n=1 Tax=Pseudomonas caspiana TaxID=1451454 RepID=UPI000B3682E1|nr:acyltransferase family protein [Pseudomonas caspiana]